MQKECNLEGNRIKADALLSVEVRGIFVFRHVCIFCAVSQLLQESKQCNIMDFTCNCETETL